MEAALAGLQLTHAQFIDLCILCGCDYTDSIKGIGPVTALKLVREHGSIEEILKKLDKDKYTLPEPFPFADARQLFVQPDVIDVEAPECDFKWTDCDADGLRKYLVEEKQFGEERINKAIERLQKCRGKSSQGRLDTFFKVLAPTPKTDAGKGKQMPVVGKGKQKLGAASSSNAAKKMKK